MATSPAAPRSRRGGPDRAPNRRFRELRGPLSPAEFAAAVRRAAREIGENVACDARYVGRVEAGEIRCPNYSYERVFIHMFPGRSLTDMGFEPRQLVRGRTHRRPCGPPGDPPDAGRPARRATPADLAGLAGPASPTDPTDLTDTEEDEVLRRSFVTGGTAALATLTSLGPAPATARPGPREVDAVWQAVRDIRLLDDRYGADALYRPAQEALRAAHALLDVGTRRQSVADGLHGGTGELAVSVGWLAHDSGRFSAARSHYAEALATARMGGDAGLEAHAFCNMAFLARDAGRPREAVRAAQAGARAARRLGSPRLRSLLALREAGGWAGMDERASCERALGLAAELYGQGPSAADPEWMTFFGEAEMASLTAQCWATLRVFGRASAQARRAVDLQEPRFTRNVALFTAELAGHLARHGDPAEAATVAHHSLELLTRVRSSRVSALLAATADRLSPHASDPAVAAFREAAA
ncbi:hypothetical protein ACTWP5_26850 [Streptomyces sp. 4N509B]|uniref:hypothetical protein n=1 Tax=Streptomyces sp. 4N509B TaxID=3457413 RepID=UPI003FD6B818